MVQMQRLLKTQLLKLLQLNKERISYWLQSIARANMSAKMRNLQAVYCIFCKNLNASNNHHI